MCWSDLYTWCQESWPWGPGWCLLHMLVSKTILGYSGLWAPSFCDRADFLFRWPPASEVRYLTSFVSPNHKRRIVCVSDWPMVNMEGCLEGEQDADAVLDHELLRSYMSVFSQLWLAQSSGAQRVTSELAGATRTSLLSACSLPCPFLLAAVWLKCYSGSILCNLYPCLWCDYCWIVRVGLRRVEPWGISKGTKAVL